MSYGGHAYGRAVYGGSTLARRARPDGGLSVPGFDAVFYWTVASTAAAYGQAAYGGRTAGIYPSAGLVAAPDVDQHIVTIPLYWAFAEFATLTRIDATTGERTPVRDSPVRLPGGSRRNPSSNPKARDALTGYTAGSNTTLARLTGLDVPVDQVSTAVRATATAAGQVSVTFSLDPASPSRTIHRMLLRASDQPASVALSVEWFDRDSASLGATSYPAPTGTAAAITGDWYDPTLTITSGPPGAATGVVSLVATGLPDSGTLDFTARISRVGGDPGAYFDGDYPGASWTGTPGLSYSDIAPIVSVVDAEAPLDVPFFYELTSAASPGFAASSEVVSLPSDALLYTERDCLITHPGLARTVAVWVTAEPTMKNAIEQSAKKIIGRRRKVVVSDSQRAGDEGQLTIFTETFVERDAIKAMLDDGSPLLFRIPVSYGHPPLWWLSLGDAEWEPLTHEANWEPRKLTVPFVEVDRPSAATRPLVV